MKKRIASLAIILAGGAAFTGCSTFGCDNYFSYNDILDTWMGSNLIDYERSNGVRPISTLKRPEHRTEYTYQTHSEWIESTHYECITRMVADDNTGEIVSWSYDGNYCIGYCRD